MPQTLFSQQQGFTETLFKDSLKKHSMQELAHLLHLHTGTLKRWKQQNRVPVAYQADFLRILGKTQDVCNETERQKDQFYTKPQVAQKCFGYFTEQAQKLGIDFNEYDFIEPSAGCGCFYDLLPKGRRIGIDIEPQAPHIIQSDYLEWIPPYKKKMIVIGNPPFGLRGNLALKFINHSYNFADVVAFILPQLFESDGKGSTMKRVVGYKLAFSRKLPINSFYYPNGKDVNINTIFQIWTKVKTENIVRPNIKSCDSYIKVYSLSDGGTPASTRNKKMLRKCDVYLPSTTFQKVRVFSSFEELPHKRGYGVVIHKNKKEIKKVLQNHDWNKTAFSSTNSALNLRTSLIQNVVIQAGFCDI